MIKIKIKARRRLGVSPRTASEGENRKGRDEANAPPGFFDWTYQRRQR